MGIESGLASDGKVQSEAPRDSSKALALDASQIFAENQARVSEVMKPPAGQVISSPDSKPVSEHVRSAHAPTPEVRPHWSRHHLEARNHHYVAKPSSSLTTGNGFGFSVLSLDGELTKLYAHPYRYDHPNPDPKKEGHETTNFIRSMAFEGQKSSDQSGYLNESNILAVNSGSSQEFYFMPFGMKRNALIALKTETPAEQLAADPLPAGQLAAHDLQSSAENQARQSVETNPTDVGAKNTATEQLTARAANEQPTARAVNEQPTARAVNEQPTARAVNEQPTARAVNEQPTARAVNEQPTARAVNEQPTARAVNEQPAQEDSASAAGPLVVEQAGDQKTATIAEQCLRSTWEHPIDKEESKVIDGRNVRWLSFRGVKESVALVPLDPQDLESAAKPVSSTCLPGTGWAIFAP